MATGLGSAQAVTPRSFTGTAITENFDGLASTGTAVTLLTGWDAGHFSTNPQQGTTGGNGLTTVTDPLVVDDGSHDTGGLPILGNFGTTGASDRALGSFARTTPAGDQFLQVAIKNDSASPIATFELTYTGEEWRSSSAPVQSLTLWYSNTDAVNGFVSMGAAFTFNSPNLSGSGATDGNATGNRTVITGTFTPTTPIAPGSTIYIRWYDINDNGVSDDFLAIDDFNFGLPAPAANILTFGPGATITGTDIAWFVPFGSDPTSLKPTYTLSSGATCDHDNGITAYDFSSPAGVDYVVSSAAPVITKTYHVNVSVLPAETGLIWNVASGGAWDLSTLNWLGQTTSAVMPFFNGANVICNKTAGGTITIAPAMAPLTTTVSATSGNYIFSGNPIATGTLTKSGGGTLQLNVTPANFSSTTVNGGTLFLQAESGFGSGLVTMTNVTVNDGGQIRSQQANVTGNLTMNGGTYDESSGWSGSWAGTIYLAADSNLRADGYGWLYIYASISGPGGLTSWSIAGNGGIFLTTSNSYTGPTIVAYNNLICQDRNALGNGGALSISNGARAYLDYSGDHVVSALSLGGVAQTSPGTYGSSTSGATYQNNTYFEGAGTVSVPAASAYGEWASGQGLTGTAGSSTDPAFDADPNKDGVANGLVWLIGGTTGNPLANSNAILPVPTAGGGKLVLSFKCLKSGARGTANLTVQFSKDLGAGDGWHGVSVPDSDQADGGSGVGFVVVPIAGSDYNTVTATIAAPALGGKLFGRLMATEN